MSCHITNDDAGMYDITDVDQLIPGSSSIMPPTKRGKLQINVQQVDGTEQVHTLWPMKFFPNAGVNLFSQTCELLQGNHHNNIVASSASGDIILDCLIKTRDCWVVRIEFLQETYNERA